MTGFTDVQYRQLSADLRAVAIPRPPHYRVPEGYKSAPYWFPASRVWEMQGAEFTISPTYGAGLRISRARDQHFHGAGQSRARDRHFLWFPT
jgi:ATP-dependent DNA ligase